MDFSQKISLCLSIITAFTSVIAIVISILTLKQNSKMIEESTRAYLVFYGRGTNFSSPTYRLILKNFGSSSAKIIKFSISENIKNFAYDNDRIPFSHIEGTHIAPNQTIMSAIRTMGKELKPINLYIEYESNNKIYKDNFLVDPQVENSNTITRIATKDSELKTISYTLQDLVEKQL